MIIAYIDGSCAPANPGGVMGAGVVISINGVTTTYNETWPSRKNNTSNKAEYLALKKLLIILKDIKGELLIVNSDSQLITTQMSGKAKINRGIYKETALECRELLKELNKYNKIKFNWVSRDKNEWADALSKK